MDDSKEKSWLKRIRGTKGYEILSAFIKSAAVGLLFAVLCFVYDVYHDSEQDKQLKDTVDKLVTIEQSLSTRYLGIFPDYIPIIDGLFEDLKPSDTVVIFEDVLYYGIKSRPKEFFNLNEKLFEHARNGGSVTVAYYNYTKTKRTLISNVFHKMIIESRISPKYHAKMNERRNNEILKFGRDSLVPPGTLRRLDSVLCEEYFKATRDDDPEKFKKDIDAYLSKALIDTDAPISSASELITYEMCVEIDSVKQQYLGNGKPIENVLFSDYETMYRKISGIIGECYAKHGINLVPLDEYLTMSCWMVQKGDHSGVKTVLAFPSKYSSDEIGFYSQDEAFAKYIGTMLEGVKQNRRIRHDN